MHCKSHINFCVKLLRKTKKQHYINLHIESINNSKTFWKTVKPYFSNNIFDSAKTTSVGKDTIVTDDKQIAKAMNSFFINTTKNLNSKPSKTFGLTDVDHITSDYDSHSFEKLHEFFPNINSGDFAFKEFF